MNTIKFTSVHLSEHLSCHSATREYPVSAEEYELLEEAGRGVSATVRPLNKYVLCCAIVVQVCSRTNNQPVACFVE